MEKIISSMELSTLLCKSKHSCVNLSLAEFRVLTYLLACANTKDGEGYKCWPSTETISEHTGIHIKTVEKARKTLVECGWMQYKQGKGKGNCNTYFVNGFKIVECAVKSGLPRPVGIIATAAKIDAPKSREPNTSGLKQGKATPKPEPVQAPPEPSKPAIQDDAPKDTGTNPDGSFKYWPNGERRYSHDDVMPVAKTATPCKPGGQHYTEELDQCPF